METKANYILIGAFTLVGIAGILALLFWFARVELDRQFAIYEIEFTTVLGLGRASEVRFGGLLVGQVTDLRLSPGGTGAILVEIQVDAATPVRVDSLATIAAQGVTGVSFVALDAGSPDAPPLAEVSEATPPRIPAGQSMMQSLSQDAPALLAEALTVARQLNTLLDTENRDRVDRILRNSEDASAARSQTLRDLSETTGAATGLVGEARRFNDGWETLVARLGGLADGADATLSRLDDLAEEAGVLLGDGSDTLRATTDIVAEADRYLDEEASLASEGLRLLLVDLRREIGDLSEEARPALAPPSARRAPPRRTG
ncbi:MlaD family protein [Limimaricola cinnabarinus]|nr:MlaD family protein [Limimaricola cinnabarinus]